MDVLVNMGWSDTTVRSGIGADSALIDEALKLCRARGIAALTFRSLANEAAIPAATLQSRFGKKEQILELTFRSAVDAELQALEQLSALTDMAGPSLEHAHALFRQRSEEHTSELQSRENLVCR